MINLESVKLRAGYIAVTRGFLAGCAALTLVFPPSLAAGKKDSLTPSELFSLTNVYTAHFHFTPEAWDTMEPDQAADFGRAAGRGAMQGGAPRRGPVFGPGMILGPAILSAGDANKDKKVSAEEFAAVGEKWYASIDKEKKGEVDGDALRDGLTATVGGGPGAGAPRIRLQGEEGKRNGLASAMGVEFEYVKADLEFADRKFTNVAVRYKGNGTWMMSQGSIKRSMKVDLNEFVKGQKIAGISKLNFHNCVTDPSYMNEVLSHALYRDAGVPAPRTAYVRVYVTVPGKHDKKYLGAYSLVENIDDNFTDERFKTTKGSIFKPVTPELFAYLGDDWANYKQTYDAKDDPSSADTQRVINFAKLVTNGSDEEFAKKAGDYLDLDQFARYMAGTVWLSTLDSILGIGQNYYLYLEPKTKKFQFFPWDLDHSFGQFFLMGDQAQRNTLSIEKPWRGENRFLERVFKLDAFQKLYRARLKEINETIGQPERITKEVDLIAAAIRPAVQEESQERLTSFDKAVGSDNFARATTGGPPGMNMDVQPIKKFVAERKKSVAAQLAGESKGADLDVVPDSMRRNNFGPGMFLAPAFTAKFDSDRNGNLSRDEFVGGFSKWFAALDKEKSGAMDEEQLRSAINEQFMPFGGEIRRGNGVPRPERRSEEVPDRPKI